MRKLNKNYFSSSSKIEVEVSVNSEYSEATFQRILEDMLFFGKKSIEPGCDEVEKKRYARMAIILSAFYLESLSNNLFDKLANQELQGIDYRSGLPDALKRFRVIYRQFKKRELDIDINGIRDIFYIRNHIIAHPAGRARLQGTNSGWVPVGKSSSYNKFKNFPFAYSHFNSQHAKIVLNEVRVFCGTIS